MSKNLSNSQLNKIWQNILDKKYDENATYKPEKIPSSDGKEIMSIQSDDTLSRCVYERYSGETLWRRV